MKPGERLLWKVATFTNIQMSIQQMLWFDVHMHPYKMRIGPTAGFTTYTKHERTCTFIPGQSSEDKCLILGYGKSALKRKDYSLPCHGLPR
jgi:hypothetical protein